MRIVVALGGNALLRRGEPAELDVQKRNVAEAVRSLAALADRHELVVTHGNGPQVGLLALREASYRMVGAYPLDVLGAESEGMIGYLLEQELRNELPAREVATLLTQVIVSPDDPAFSAPSKPVGPVYTREVAEEQVRVHGWAVAPDGDGFRRVVPSPEPRRIVELAAITTLLEARVIVICVGGGGIPVVVGQDGGLRGVEAVIDKDLAAAVLAEALHADLLLLLTDVDNVEVGFGTPDARPLGAVTLAELRQHEFAPGSMGPKVEAACRFVERTGRQAAIGSLAGAGEVVAGRAGTRVGAPAGADGARAGDWIVVHPRSLDAPGRRGQILETLGVPGHEHYRVRRDEEHESIFYPSGGFTIERAASSAASAPKRGRKPKNRKEES
jgi:carbamate kinase